MRHDSYLLQRLLRPYADEVSPRMANLLEATAFGGGYRNGGLSPEAMALLRPLFGFDYMGSAEFEFGAVPEALSVLAGHANDDLLDLHSFVVDLDDVAVPSFLRARPGVDEPKGTKTIHVLAHRHWVDEIEERLRRWITTEPFSEGAPRFKESPRIHETLLGTRPAAARDIIGWLELDNGWLAFADEETALGTANLFGITIPEGSAA